MTDDLLTVGQVAERFGITVRTLHHYDAIGLVTPSERSWADYRLYSPGDVQRLARVVLLRRLEMPLADIGAVLADDDALTEQLRRRREAVIARLDELNGLVRAIDTALTREEPMSDYAITEGEMKEIFGTGYDESYDAEAEARWGETDAYKESQRRAKSYTKEQWGRIKAEGDAVMERFAQAKRDGAESGSEQADAAVQAHRDHIETWFNDVPLPMLRGMGEMFSADPRFAKTYDDVEPDLAPYVTSVITAYCAKRGVVENCGS